MIGFAPGTYWRVCWRFLAPLFLLFITVYGIIGYEPLSYGDYTYPGWANALGWCIAGSSVIMIPGMAIYKIIVTPGSLKQVSNKKGEFRKKKKTFLFILLIHYSDCEYLLHRGVINKFPLMVLQLKRRKFD